MKHLRKITAILTAVIGLVVIVLGISLMGQTAGHDVDVDKLSHDAEYYNAEYASFGGDFYTYIYGASDIIVDELYDINSGLGTVVAAQRNVAEAVAVNVEATDSLNATVCKVGGTVVMAIGLAILSCGLLALGAAFVPAAPAPVSEPKPAYYAPVE